MPAQAGRSDWQHQPGTAVLRELFQMAFWLARNDGVMEPGLLCEPPFTGHAPCWPNAMFTSTQVDELFVVLAQVAATARAA